MHFFSKEISLNFGVVIVEVIRGRRRLRSYEKGQFSTLFHYSNERIDLYTYTLACHKNGYRQGLIEAFTNLMKSTS